MIELRARTRIPASELEQKVGKIMTRDDYNVLLTGPTKVVKPNGDPLCIYLPRALKAEAEAAYPILTGIRLLTTNRGYASGSERAQSGKNSYALPVYSGILGAIEQQGGRHPYCRQTAWTTQNPELHRALYPFYQKVADLFEFWVPDRYAKQVEACRRTKLEWVIPGTPFTTVTVNNSYPTGVHLDAGDLAAGFSCLAVLRRGVYCGAELAFPEYRIAMDLRDGDLVLMDAHEWHGNCEFNLAAPGGHERISVVMYFREGLQRCGTMEEEHARAKRAAQRAMEGTSDGADEEGEEA